MKFGINPAWIVIATIVVSMTILLSWELYYRIHAPPAYSHDSVFFDTGAESTSVIGLVYLGFLAWIHYLARDSFVSKTYLAFVYVCLTLTAVLFLACQLAFVWMKSELLIHELSLTADYDLLFIDINKYVYPMFVVFALIQLFMLAIFGLRWMK